MNVNANKRAVRRFFHGMMEKNRPELLDELCVEDFVVYWPSGKPLTGLAQAKEFVSQHNNWSPDCTWEIKDLVAESDMVAVRLVKRETDKGGWASARPTGKKFSFCEHTFFRFRDGKIAEMWPLLVDIDERKEQLGFRSLPPDS